MKGYLKKTITGLLGLFLTLNLAVHAQDLNELKVVVPFPPGGGGDTFARSVADQYGKMLGKKVWVANRPGAAGNIGSMAVSEAPADGSVIGYITNGIMCANPVLYKKMKFDPLQRLKPIGQISKINLVMVLNPKAVKGVSDFDSFVKYAKSHPNVLNYASSGVGTTSHVAAEYLADKLGISLTHIPHQGGAAAMVEVMAGRIPMMIDVSSNVLPYLETGKIVPLAVTGSERLKALPNVPTLQEKGVKDYEIYAWDGFALPEKPPMSCSKSILMHLKNFSVMI